MLSATDRRVHVTIVNRDTAREVSHLLFSLFRIVGRECLGRVLVVDNASTDGSRELLLALKDAGLIHLILNRRNKGHGPSLNQAFDLLAACALLEQSPQLSEPIVWVLDSDVVILRQDVVCDALNRLHDSQAALLGEFQYDALPEGYAHPSALFVDLQQTFLAGIGRFDDSGAPALSLHQRLRQRRVPIADYPVRSDGYVLHLGRTTRRMAAHRSGEVGALDPSAERFRPHYHDHPAGPQLHGAFLQVFSEHVPALSPEVLVTVCVADGRVAIPRPLDPGSFSPSHESQHE